MRNASFYLPKEQVEKYVESDKGMKADDCVYRKHNFNGYETVKSFIFRQKLLILTRYIKCLMSLTNEFNN